jgi:hypothetical protein
MTTMIRRVSVADLLKRYKIACDLKQAVDRDRILSALKRWACNIGIPDVTIQFATNAKEVEAAARAAKDTWDANVASAASAAMDAWNNRITWNDRTAMYSFWNNYNRAARAARATWATNAAWVAWDMSYISTSAIGASSKGDDAALQKWLPAFEAFEAGAFELWIGAETIYTAVIPSVLNVDDQRHLHCENGPAFAWLDDIRDYYWRGVNVPEAWIMDRGSLTAEAALSEQNIERRRAACEMLGWDAILSKLGATTIDRDGDPQIGELVEVKLPGEGQEKITARYLRVQCGTGRLFAVCVPPDTRTALDAQAWMLGLPPDKFTRPEIRT